jgi:hypothetical protein
MGPSQKQSGRSIGADSKLSAKQSNQVASRIHKELNQYSQAHSGGADSGSESGDDDAVDFKAEKLIVRRVFMFTSASSNQRAIDASG